MSRVDNCLYWQAIFRLMAVQYHCHSLIVACTTLSDTSIMFVHVCRKHVFARVPTQRASVQMTETGFVVYIVSFCVYGLLFLIGGGGGWGLSQQSLHVEGLYTSYTRLNLNLEHACQCREFEEES